MVRSEEELAQTQEALLQKEEENTLLAEEFAEIEELLKKSEEHCEIAQTNCQILVADFQTTMQSSSDTFAALEEKMRHSLAKIARLKTLPHRSKQTKKKLKSKTKQRQESEMQLSSIITSHKKTLGDIEKKHQEIPVRKASVEATLIQSLTSEKESLQRKVDDLEQENHELAEKVAAVQRAKTIYSPENYNYKQELLQAQEDIRHLTERNNT